MKTIEKMGFQGDVMFRASHADQIPKNARKATHKAGDKIVVAHSETGHHHVIEVDRPVDYYETDDPLTSYIHVPGAQAPGMGLDVVHLRPWDTHEPVRLLGETWEIKRQREWAPEGWQPVQD